MQQRVYTPALSSVTLLASYIHCKMLMIVMTVMTIMMMTAFGLCLSAAQFSAEKEQSSKSRFKPRTKKLDNI